MRIRILLSILFSIVCRLNAPAQAQPDSVRNTGLGECVKMAVEHNYGVKIARNRSRMAANNVTGSEFMPVVALTGSASQEYMEVRERFDPDPSDPGSRTDEFGNPVTGDYGANVGLTWRLFDGMAMFASYESKKELLRAGELNLRGSIEGLVADVSDQYYLIITLQNRVEAARTYLGISTIRYNQAREKNSVGVLSGLELEQAKLNFNADSSNLVLQKQVLDNAYIRFYEMMNVPLDSDIRVGEEIHPAADLDLERLLESAHDNNTALLLARSGQAVSESDLRIARASRYPTIDFKTGYSFRHTTNSTLESRFQERYGPNVGLSLSMNIFNGMEARRRVRNASLGLSNNEMLVRQTQLEVESNLTQIYNIYQKNITMIGFEAESAETARRNMEAAMEMHRIGSISGTDFREIQRSYIDAINRCLDALYQAKASEITLLYYSGMLLD